MSTANLNISNGLPTYGKWGGSGWSAGEPVSSGTPLTDEQKQYYVTDQLDQVFKDHDINYDDAERLTDPTDQALAILNADIQLIGSTRRAQ